MTAYSVAQSGNWDDVATWGGAGYPSEAADVANINYGGDPPPKTVTVNIDTPTIAEINVSGSFMSFLSVNNNLNTVGNINLSGGYFFIGAGAELNPGGAFIYTGGTHSGSFIINGAFEVAGGTYTLGADLTINNGSFEISGGSISTGGTWDVIANNSSVTYTAGTVTSLNLRTTGTSTALWTPGAASSASNCLLRFVIASGTTSVASRVKINPNANDFFDVQGTLAGAGEIRIFIYNSSKSLSTRVVMAPNLSLSIVNGLSLTLTGEVDLTGYANIYGNGTTTPAPLIVQSPLASFSAVSLGLAGSTRPGRLDLSKTVKMTSLIAQEQNPGVQTVPNQLNLGSCFMELTGTIDGTNITVTNDDETVRIVNPVGGSGTVTNVTFEAGKKVHGHDLVSIAGSTDIDNNVEAYPNLKATAMAA